MGVFNNFIANASLFDVPLGGFSFTWPLKVVGKMIKLDIFLIYEGLLEVFFSISGVILDHHLPGHRPILLKESVIDYGSSPFRIFHS